MVARRVWQQRGYANERDGCCLSTKIRGGIVVSTTAFGHGPYWRGPIGDRGWDPPVAYTAVALPRLCRGKTGGGYHWDNCWGQKIPHPFSCSGLAERHEQTCVRVLRGEIALAPACVRCAAQIARLLALRDQRFF